jgi:hypothetical protein
MGPAMQHDEQPGVNSTIPFPVLPCVGEIADVERVDHFPLYELGKTLEAVSRRGDVLATNVFFAVHSASVAMEQLLDGTPFPLGISRNAALEFKKELQRIWDTYFTEQDENGAPAIKFPDEKTQIPNWAWSRVPDALKSFETIFRAEMGEMTTYFVPKRGIYATAALAETADESFPADLTQFIPEKTKLDWREAGRCMAFNLLSACGFHVARAVEGTMEAYYQLFSGKSGKTLRSWDDYHKELAKIAEGKPTPAPEEKTLIEFDQMRRDYRNPIVHPRVALGEADIRILFNNGESLIIAMASEIKRAQISQGGVQPTLSLISPAALP